MKKLPLLFLFSGFAFAGRAQSDKQKVTERQTQFDAALMHPDSLVFDKLLSDSLSYGHSAWKIESKSAFFEDILHSGPKFSHVAVDSQTVAIVGENAIVREIFRADLSTGSQTTQVKLGILLVWQKQKRDWRLLARQAVKLAQ